MKINKYLIPAIGLFFLGCSGQILVDDLQSGDLVFCSYKSGELSGAISNVTKTEQNKNYSHMGIVEISDTQIFVIHATLKRGVVKESIQNFIQKDQAASIDVYRLKKSYQQFISKAIERANGKVGLPYNFEYLLNDNSYYCSQLIYDIFKTDNLFQLEPMTFKNPETNHYNKGWVNYYRNLNSEIPEGKPGCNPNGLAISDKLKFVGNLNQNFFH